MKINVQVFFFLLVCCFFQEGMSQTISKVDSLLKVYEDATDPKAKVDHLLNVARQYRRIEPETHLLYAKRSLEEAELANYKKGQGISLSEIASYFQKADQYDSSFVYYKRAIPFFEKNKNIGNAYSRLSTVEKARGNYIESVELLIKADSLFREAGFTKGSLMSNANLGILLSMQGDLEKALAYYERAEKLLAVGDDRYKSILYTNFAITHNELGNLKEAEAYNLKSLTIREKLNDVYGLGIVQGNLGSIALKKRDTLGAISRYLLAEEYYKKANSKFGLSGTYNNLGNLYRAQGKFNKAKEFLNLGNALAKEIQNHEAIANSEESLFQFHKDLGEWQHAFIHLETFMGLRDSLFEREKTEVVQKLQTELETQRLEQEKQLAESDTVLAETRAQKSKNFSIAMALLGGIILLMALFYLYRFRSRKKRELLLLQVEEYQKRLDLEQQTRQSELKALQSQMNPHFVFNALNSIQDLILLQDVRSSNKYLARFSQLLRDILEMSDKGFIPLQKEIEVLENYAELELLRFGDELDFSIDSTVTTADALDIQVPAMFIQPYIENALKHGLLHKRGKKILEVAFENTSEHLVCQIRDNGIGRKAAADRAQSSSHNLGFSTKANEKRIELFNAQASFPITVNIEDLYDNEVASGTLVTINFPIVEQEAKVGKTVENY